MESDKVIASQGITLTDLNDSRPSSLLLYSNQSIYQTYDVNNKQYQPDYAQNQLEITPKLFFGNEDASDKIGQQIFYYLNNNSEAVAKIGGSDAPSEAIYQQDSKLIIKLNIGQGILTGTILQIKAVIPEGVLQDTLTGEWNKELVHSLDFARLDSGADGAQGMTIQKVEQQYIIIDKKDQAPDKTDSGWSTSQGTWEKGKYLWIRTAITYYNPATKETTVEYTDPYCDSSWEAAADGIMTLEERIDNANKLIAQLEKEVDGAIETWFMEGDPNKLVNHPWFDESASVQDDPKNHEGDLYFDTVSGKSYRFFEQSEGNYSWQIITDTELTQAMADIQNLQTQVDSKVKIFYDKTAPDLSKAQLDDLWVKPDGNFYQCVGTKNADGSISNKRWDIANVSIDSVTVEYAEYTSNTIAPETGWTTASPVWSADKYVWQRTVTTFKDGAKDTHRTDPVCISAAAARGIVIAGEQVFQSTDGTNYVPSAITLTANCVGGTTVGKWYYKDKNGSWVDTNVTNSSISISSTHTAFNGGTTATIKVNAAEGDYYDIISLYKVTDGKKGANGEPASSVFLTNENITFAGNANGQVAAKTVVSNVVAYTGTTKKTPVIKSITGAPSGMTVTYGTAVNNEIPITISVAANAELGGKTEQAGTIIIEISSPVVTSLVINWSKVNTGATGEQGIPGRPGINVEIKSTDGRVIFTDNEASDIVLQAILRVGGVPQTGNVTYSWTSIPAGITGTSNTLVIKRTDVPSARSFACAIGYDGETYTGVIGIEDKTDAVYCNIDSSNGDKFTNGNISTTLTCRVYTNKQGQVDTNGSTYIYNWKKYHLVNGAMVQDTSWGTKTGKTQKLTYKDVTDKAIFSCEIKKNGSNEPIIAYDEITLQNLTDGAMLFANCLTGQEVQIKTATITDGHLALKEGVAVSVRFANANAVKEPRLNIDGTGNFPILLNGQLLTRDDCYWLSESIITFIYATKDGTPYWQIADGSSILKMADYQKNTEAKFGNYYTKAQVEEREDSIVSTVETKYAAGASRGEQLVTNGSGVLGNNTNFSWWDFDGAVSNDSPGSFTKNVYAEPTTDEFFAINPRNHYALTFDTKSLLGEGTLYSMLQFFDADKNLIRANDHMYVPDTLTTLARPVENGATTIYLTSLKNWSTATAHATFITVWNYTNSFGYTYPELSYSRNMIPIPSVGDYVDGNYINTSNNTITLTTPYSGPTIPAGTKVSQGRYGGTYKYNGIAGEVVPTEWKSVKAIYSGVDYSGGNVSTKFPPGTAYAKVGFLWLYQYQGSGERLWVTNVSVRDYSAEAELDAMGGKIVEMGTKIEQNSEAISLRATKTELEAIQVGGRNLLKKYMASGGNTTKIDDMTIQLNANGSDTYFYVSPATTIFSGEEYTISCDASNVPNNTKWNFGVGAQGNSGFIFTVDKNGRCSATGTFTSDFLAGENLILDDTSGRIASNPPIKLTNFKLEKGNKATDWSPAPEDVNDAINNVDDKFANYYTKTETSNLIVDSEGVSLEAAKEEVKKLADGTVAQHTSQITSLQVTSTGLSTSIKNVSDNLANNYTPKTIPDTRDDNQSPDWYIKNYPRQNVTEFKYCNKIGLSSYGETFCSLTTSIPWSDNTGGYPKQNAKVNTSYGCREFWRVGVSDTAWGAWTDAASTATNYMQFTSNGLEIGDYSSGNWSTNTFRTRVDANAFSIIRRNSDNTDTVVATYGTSYIYLGKNSTSSIIDFCNEKMQITYGVMGEFGGKYTGNLSRITSAGSLALEAPGSLGLFTKGSGYNCYIKIGPQSSNGDVKAIELITDQGTTGKSSLAINYADIKLTSNKTYISAALDVGGVADFSGVINAKSALNVTGISNLSGGAAIGGDLTGANNKALSLKSDLTSTGSITLTAGGITSKGNIATDGAMTIKSGASITGNLVMDSNSIIYNSTLASSSGQLNLVATKEIVFNAYNKGQRFCITGECIRPIGNKLYDLGEDGNRWKDIYLKNGANTFSDKKVKKDIENIDEKYQSLFNKLKPVSYRFNFKESDRRHLGFISQDVEQSMLEVGLTDLDFGGFCKDAKMEEIEIKNEELNTIDIIKRQKTDENGEPIYSYSLRYQEFIALNTKMIQLNQQRIETLEEEIKQLKLQLSKFENSSNL